MKYGADFFLAHRLLAAPQSIAADATLNGADLDCRDFFEVLILILVGAMGTDAILSGALQKKNRVSGAYTPLLDRAGNAITFAGLQQGETDDPASKLLFARVDARALPDTDNIIRVNITSADEATLLGMAAVITSRYEIPGDVNVNSIASGLHLPVMEFSTKDTLIAGNP